MKVPKRRDARSFVQSHRRVVERVRKADIARVRDPIRDGDGTGTGGTGGSLEWHKMFSSAHDVISPSVGDDQYPAYAISGDLVYLRGQSFIGFGGTDVSIEQPLPAEAIPIHDRFLPGVAYKLVSFKPVGEQTPIVLWVLGSSSSSGAYAPGAVVACFPSGLAGTNFNVSLDGQFFSRDNAAG